MWSLYLFDLFTLVWYTQIVCAYFQLCALMISSQSELEFSLLPGCLCTSNYAYNLVSERNYIIFYCPHSSEIEIFHCPHPSEIEIFHI